MEMKMGRCYMDGAYEVAEIMFSDVGKLEEWMESGDSWPHTLPATLAGWYLFEPKPAAEDIAGIPKVELRGAWYVVTFRIRRGKDLLAAFINQHSMPTLVGPTEKGIGVLCASCKTGFVFPWDSFGHLGGELVRAQVAPPDASQALCAGAIRGAGGNTDSGPDAQRGEGSAGTDSTQS